jgi:hypothetical protein
MSSDAGPTSGLSHSSKAEEGGAILAEKGEKEEFSLQNIKKPNLRKTLSGIDHINATPDHPG